MDKKTTTIRTLLNMESGIAHFVSGNKTLCGITINNNFMYIKTISYLCDVCRLNLHEESSVYIQK